MKRFPKPLDLNEQPWDWILRLSGLPSKEAVEQVLAEGGTVTLYDDGRHVGTIGTIPAPDAD